MARSGPRAATILSLLFLAAGAWALSAVRMPGMGGGPASDLGGLGWFTGTWVLMMAAMMLPSLAPGLPAHVRAHMPFVLGYLLAWTVAGLAAYALIATVRSLDLGFLAWAKAGPYLDGGVIVAAGVYQLTPFKAACLRRCRRPSRRAEGERPAPAAALRAGLDYGAACIGCCWMLMAALFALGLMSLLWMAVIAAFVAVEKLLPWRRSTSAAIALLLVALGLAVALTPGHVPGFMSPAGSKAAVDSTFVAAPRSRLPARLA